MATRFSLRGVTTFPVRSEHSFNSLGKLVSGRKSLQVTEIGPGIAWKRTAHLLPPKGVVRNEHKIRDSLVKVVDRIGRRLSFSGKSLLTFEPFELAHTLSRSLGTNASFEIVVLDKHTQTQKALQNHPDSEKFKKNVRFLNGNITHTSIPKSDVIVAQQVLWYVNREKALSNIVASLNPKGLLITNELTKKELSTFGLKLIKNTLDGQIYQKK